MSQHVFFQEFGIPQRDNQKIDPVYSRNTMVLEISNNWPFARWMMDKYRNGDLKKVDNIERDWLHFIINNNIDVEKYGKDSDNFINEHFKTVQ